MKTPIRRKVIGCPLILAGLIACCQAEAFDHSHQLLSDILKQHVKDGVVNYAGLKAGRRELDRYLGRLAAAPEREFTNWSQPQQIAFLVNLYNAATLQLILDHYPVKSIKDIGSLLKGPWKQPVVRLFGQSVTLDHVEHEILRKKYEDPRVHFALVCAARGCPPLRTEAYAAERLEDQFEEQGRKFLSSPHKNHVDAANQTVYLSPIFKWFGDDFVKKSGSVLAFVRSYFPEETQKLIREEFTIRYTDYDWSLNDSAAAGK